MREHLTQLQRDIKAMQDATLIVQASMAPVLLQDLLTVLDEFMSRLEVLENAG